MVDVAEPTPQSMRDQPPPATRKVVRGRETAQRADHGRGRDRGPPGRSGSSRRAWWRSSRASGCRHPRDILVELATILEPGYPVNRSADFYGHAWSSLSVFFLGFSLATVVGHPIRTLHRQLVPGAEAHRAHRVGAVRDAAHRHPTHDAVLVRARQRAHHLPGVPRGPAAHHAQHGRGRQHRGPGPEEERQGIRREQARDLSQGHPARRPCRSS